jgi:glycosyltransferase involved in cell wall biosynthesis/predicted Zn-dependent protease
MVVRPFEAMAAGAVAFQNDIVGARSNRLFKDGENIIMYDHRDPAGLARKIEDLLADPERAEEIARRGRREVLARHTIKHRVGQVLDWLAQSAAAQAVPVAGAGPLPAGDNKKSVILIDGVIFQFQKECQGGISKVWLQLLAQLAQSELKDDILILIRKSTNPPVPKGLRTRFIDAYEHINFEADSLYLQDICDQENAALFISTYYTYPEKTRSIVMLHDMTPEVLGMDLEHAEWRAKAAAITKAAAYVCVSQSTQNDFKRLYPEHSHKSFFITPNAVTDVFSIHKKAEVEAFKARYGIRKPYFILVGHRQLYKNAVLFFKAFNMLEERDAYEIVCVGGNPELEKTFLPFVSGVRCSVLSLNEYELALAYNGAAALVYPSLYEGFGLPVLEAMRSGCPVIALRHSSLPEVTADAAILIDGNDVQAMKKALQAVRRKDRRESLIKKGLTRATMFSWKETGKKLVSAIKSVMAHDAGQVPVTSALHTWERLSYVLGKSKDYLELLDAMAAVKKYYEDEYSDSRLMLKEFTVSCMDDVVLGHIQAAVDDGTGDDIFQYWLGLALIRRGLYGKALRLLLRACRNRKTSHLLFLCGYCAYCAGDNKTAKEMLLTALKKDGHAAHIPMLLSIVENGFGKMPKEPGKIDSAQAVQAVKAMREKNGAKQALQALEGLITSYPAVPEFLILAAEIRLIADQKKEAEEILTGVLNVWPRNVTAANRLTGLYINARNFGPAAELNKRVLMSDPNDQEARIFAACLENQREYLRTLAEQYLESGNVDFAEAVLEDFITVWPYTIEALNKLCKIKISRNKYADARSLCRKAHKLDPDNRESAENASLLETKLSLFSAVLNVEQFMEKNEFAKAREFLERLPDMPLLESVKLNYLSAIAIKEGKPDSARQMLKRLLKIDPDNKIAQERAMRLFNDKRGVEINVSRQ